jgi:hypothetical protein
MAVNATLQSDAVGSTVKVVVMLFFSKNDNSCPIAVREFLDPKTLNAKYTQSQIKAGSSDTETLNKKLLKN